MEQPSLKTRNNQAFRLERAGLILIYLTRMDQGQNIGGGSIENTNVPGASGTPQGVTLAHSNPIQPPLGNQNQSQEILGAQPASGIPPQNTDAPPESSNPPNISSVITSSPKKKIPTKKLRKKNLSSQHHLLLALSH